MSKVIKGKHNVHQAIKHIGRILGGLYNRLQDEERGPKQKLKPAIQTVSQTTQVTPNCSAIDLPSNKRMREKNGDLLENKQAPKKKKGKLIVSKNGTNSTKMRKPKPLVRLSVADAKGEPKIVDRSRSLTKMCRKKPKVRIRSDAIVISNYGNQSYVNNV